MIIQYWHAKKRVCNAHTHTHTHTHTGCVKKCRCQSWQVQGHVTQLHTSMTSPSSMSSWVGVWLAVIFEPSNWKFILAWPPDDRLAVYWERMEPRVASCTHTHTRVRVCVCMCVYMRECVLLTLCSEYSRVEPLSIPCMRTVMMSLLCVSCLVSSAMTTQSTQHNKSMDR